MTINKNAIVLRAQEIVARSGSKLLLQEALEMALREQLAGDGDAIAELARMLSANGALRKATYDLPEDHGQTQLFEIPGWLVVQSPEGELAVPRSQATVGDVRQWRREGLQHHSVQHLRFKRAGEDLEHIKDVADDMPWASARTLILERRAELTEIAP